MECKSALKMRWTPVEVVMLTEEWASVCSAPNTKTLKGEELSKVLFERYNSRCARTRQLRRSPNAVATQRDRMLRFARFVANFDNKALTRGSRAWFDLSYEEHQEIEIPNEWRRQVTTFTPELLNTFKRVILPAENAHGSAKRKKPQKLGTKVMKVSSQSAGKQQVVSRVEHQPCWTLQEKVRLIQRWGEFMKQDELTVEHFEEMTFNNSCKSLASSTRSSFTAWRKMRTLLSSWGFIVAFNKRHQPGWFDLTETERDSRIMWGELPDNFEDIEHEVYVTMEETVPKDTGQMAEELNPPDQSPDSPSWKVLSSLQPAPLGSAPLLTDLCPKGASDESLYRLLLEDDGADNVVTINESQQPDVCVIEALSGNHFVPDACIVVTQKPPHGMLAGSAIKPEIVSGQPLEPIPIVTTESLLEELELTQQTHRSKVLRAICQLRAALDQGNKQTMECIRALKPGQFSGTNTVGLLKHANRVLEQQNKRLMSVLRLAEETSSQNDAEIQSLMQNVLGNGLNPSRAGTTGLDVVVHVTAPTGLAQF